MLPSVRGVLPSRGVLPPSDRGVLPPHACLAGGCGCKGCCCSVMAGGCRSTCCTCGACLLSCGSVAACRCLGVMSGSMPDRNQTARQKSEQVGRSEQRPRAVTILLSYTYVVPLPYPTFTLYVHLRGACLLCVLRLSLRPRFCCHVAFGCARGRPCSARASERCRSSWRICERSCGTSDEAASSNVTRDGGMRKKRDRSQAVVPPGGFGTSSRHKLTEKETSDHASNIFGRRHFVWLWIVALQIQTRPRDTGTTATCASCRFRRTRRSHASSSCHSRRRPHA